MAAGPTAAATPEQGARTRCGTATTTHTSHTATTGHHGHHASLVGQNQNHFGNLEIFVKFCEIFETFVGDDHTKCMMSVH
jgi:hypothetical protein